MTATYYASVRESAVGANKQHMTIWNATGSGKTMVCFRIVAVGAPTGTVSGQKVLLAALRMTAQPTGGSSLALAKAVPSGPDAPAQVTVVTGSTAGTAEATAFGLGGVSGEETAFDNESVIYEAPIDGSEQVEFPEGTGLQVRQGTLAAAGAVSLVAVVGLV